MPSSQSITAIVAATLQNGIGKDGSLPWRLPNEMKYFARVTTAIPASTASAEDTGSAPPRHNAVIMGRKTWESIPPKFRPLKDRRNLVISRSDLQLSEPLTTAHKSLESALAAISSSPSSPSSPSSESAQDPTRTFLIGGAQLYNLSLTSTPPLVDRILLTRILDPFPCDTFLHDFSSQADIWTRASHTELCEWVGFPVPEGEVEERGVRYRFEMWVRR